MTAEREQARRAAAAALEAREQAKIAEAAALEARNATDLSNRQFAEMNRLVEEALKYEREGKRAQAEALVRQADQVKQANTGTVLTPSEISELDRLRRQEAEWRRTEAALRAQLTSRPPVADVAVAKTDMPAADRAELERLRSAESAWQRDRTQLTQQLATANDRAATLQQAESSLRKRNEELQARASAAAPAAPPAASTSDRSDIEQLLRDFQTAYARRDAEAVARLMPSTGSAELAKSFSQLRAYEMEILDPQISIAGDTAVVTALRRITIEPRVGSRPAPRTVPSVFRLKKSAGVWTIEAVEEKR
jgi:ketosteroid isomerase-like protein